MALSFEEFKKLRQQGYTSEQLLGGVEKLPPLTQQKTSMPQFSPVSEEPPQKKEGFLPRVGRFLGLEGLGKGIASSILAHTDKKYKRILEKAQKEPLTPGERAYLESIANEIPSEREVVGSAIQTAATMATLGGAAKAGTIKAGMAKIGGLGAISGAGKAIEQEKDTGDILKQSFASGLTSALTYGALAGAGKVAKSVLKEMPVRLMQSTAKLERDAAKKILDARQVGSLGKLKGFVNEESKRLNTLIRSKIKTNNETIDTDRFMKGVTDQLKRKWTGVSDEKLKAAIENSNIDPFLKNKKIDFLTADKIRQELGRTIGTAWRTDDPKFHASVRRTLWQEIVNQIRPKTGTTELFKEYAPLIKANNTIERIMETQAKKFGLSLYDIGPGAVGAALGGAPGAIGGVIARRMFDSVTGKTVSAVGLNELSNIIEKIPTDTAGKISKTILINLLKGKQD